MPDNQCENCRWWGAECAHDDDQPYGSCRVNAPVANGSKRIFHKSTNGSRMLSSVERCVPNGEWPWTAFDDWCGKHELKGG